MSRPGPRRLGLRAGLGRDELPCAHPARFVEWQKFLAPRHRPSTPCSMWIYIYVVIYLDSLFSRSFFLSCYFLHPFHWRFLPRYGEKVVYLGRESRSSARCRGLTTCCSGNFFFFVFFLFLPFPLPSEASEGNCCERGASCVHSEPRPDDYPN